MVRATLALLSLLTAGPLAAQEQLVSGFVREALYTGAAGEEVGARYRHVATGLELRVLRIESVPQVFIHVAAAPTSDMGEPHTGEHLLLGKGTRGKALAAAEEMSLVESTAYTGQTEVCYSFNCAAGAETFFGALDQTLEALLYPDYTDEEIRREVCHLGVVRDPKTGALELEEKGTVYNEMVATYEKRWVVFYELGRRVYGAGHPLSNSAGGTPEGIRALTPEAVRAFHAENYRLDRMGLIASLPPAIPTADFLARLDAICGRLVAAEGGEAAAPRPPAELPPPETSRDRSILRVPYPTSNEQDTGYVVLAWPPRPAEEPASHLLRRLFVEAFADGETGHLHRVLIDSQTRSLEVAATRVWGGLDATPLTTGAMVGLTGYQPEAATEERLRAIERTLRAEVDRLAALPPGDPALTTFSRRVETRLLELERGLKQRLSMPPLFGRRGAGGFWLDHLRLVDRGGGARRSLVLSDAVAAVRAVVADALEGRRNPWAGVIDDLGLRDAPLVGVSVPSREEVARRAEAREARLAAALARLQEESGAEDPEAALTRLEAEQAAKTRELEARDAAIPRARLVEDVPRTLDDRLEWDRVEVAGLPAVRGHFETMSAVEVGLYLPLGGVARDELALLPLLPSLLTGAGLVDGSGERLPYDALRERLDREIAGLSAGFDLRPEAGRYELRITAAGADAAEGALALEWLRRCLLETDLTAENLPRLRDLVLQLGRDLRGSLGRSEESWVRNPARALRFEDDPLFLSAGSIFTQLHHLFRLRWLLAPAPAGEDARRAGALFAVLRALAQQEGAEPALSAVSGAIRRGAWDEVDLPGLDALRVPLEEAEARAFLEATGLPLLEALAELVEDLPLPTRAADLERLLATCAADLATPPEETLARLRGLTALLRPGPGARLVLTGRRSTLEALEPGLAAALGAVGAAEAPARAAGEPAGRGAPLVTGRVRERDLAPDAPRPVHLGLVHEASSSGVFVFSADAAPRAAADREALLDLLAGSVDAGAGPHAFFMNTWGAGLAYSNGLRVSPLWGRSSYYAERCPDLVQTMRFVVGLAGDAARYEDPALADYALAQLVSAHRASDRFEARTRALAADLEDGLPPEVVAAQREALMALREDPDLWAEVAARRAAAEGRVLVGLGAPSREQAGGIYLVIAPERLLAEWGGYVAETEGERLHRVWPADFWLWERPQ